MTTDEVKAYLWQAYKLDKRLRREQMKLEKLRASIEYRSPAFDGMGGHEHSRAFAEGGRAGGAVCEEVRGDRAQYQTSG